MLNLTDLACELEFEYACDDQSSRIFQTYYPEYHTISEYAQHLVLEELQGKDFMDASDDLELMIESCGEELWAFYGFDDPFIYIDEEHLQNSQFCTGNEAIDRYMRSLLPEYVDEMQP